MSKPYPRNIEKFKNFILFKSFEEMKEFDFLSLKENQEYLFSIIFEDLEFDFKLNIGNERNLVILFNSAIPESKVNNVEFPFFTGSGITAGLKSTKIFFCDPLLKLSTSHRTFWYIGSKKLPTQKIIFDTLNIIKTQLEINKMIFWGSSGGGYPALFLSNMFDDSVALVNAPTTTVVNHHNKDVIENIKSTLLSINDEVEGYLDLTTFSSQKNKVIFLQNINDKVFIKNHLNPYLESKSIENTGGDILEGNYKVIYRNWGKGHLVAPTYIIKNFLRLLERENGNDLSIMTPQRINSIVNLDIFISNKGKYIFVKIANIEEEATFAIYICKGKRVVDKIMYQNNNLFFFERKKLQGSFYIKVFVKFKKDNFILINDSITFTV